MKIRLFNHYGNGDLFASREFVKELVQSLPNVQFEYSHGKSSRMFADIENLGYSKIDNNCDNAKSFFWIDGVLYINTWVGLNGRYVTPANTVSLTNLKRLFNDYLSEIHGFEKDVNEYIPYPNFKAFPMSIRMYTFMQKFNNKTKVLISNCNAQSGQAENFNFDPIIYELCNEFPEFIFIVTNDTMVVKDNLFMTKDLTNTSDGFDLNEISYLSLFCNPIIGRGSGAYCFTINKPNCFNKDKYFIAFTKSPYGATITSGQDLPCHFLSTPETNERKVFDYICKVLRG